MQVLDVDLSVDLEAFSAFLWQQGIRHQVFESGGRQIVDVADPNQADAVRAIYADLQSGALNLRMERAPGPLLRLGGLAKMPVVTAVSLACLLLFPFSMGWLPGSNAVLSSLLLAPVAANGLMTGGVTYPLVSGELWRLLSPALLHFSLLHIAFNLGVYAFIGRRIESLQGSSRLLLVVLFTALASAVVQGLWNPGSPFGGLSGVCYGVVGYAFVAQRRQPHVPWHLPPGLLPFLLLSLLVFSTGVTEAFGLYVANAAHWGGLAAGAALAVVVLPSVQQGQSPPT